MNTNNNSLRREALKRAKYALRHKKNAPLKVYKKAFGGWGPGDFDNRGGGLFVKTGEMSIMLFIPSTTGYTGDERKWARNWYTPLEKVWSEDFMSWAAEDETAKAVLVAIVEAMCNLYDDLDIRFETFDKLFYGLYEQIAGEKPALFNNRIGY